jgi:peptidoglycan/xylan/chitin deacetylase (PgdA/CDA1 family)
MRELLALTAGLLVIVAIVAAAAALVIWWPRIVVRALRSLFRGIVWDLPTTKPVVALTFDDGPDPVFTPQVLDILHQHDIKATFFLVGERARRYASLASRIRDEGHGIGNHSGSWRRTTSLSNDEFERDLLWAQHSIAVSEPPKLFRPAGGPLKPGQARVLRKLGYVAVLGSAYAFDPHRPPKRYIEWAIARALRPGAIIVLHDSGGDRSNTVAALPGIIDNAKKQGFRFVKLSEHIQPK